MSVLKLRCEDVLFISAIEVSQVTYSHPTTLSAAKVIVTEFWNTQGITAYSHKFILL